MSFEEKVAASMRAEEVAAADAIREMCMAWFKGDEVAADFALKLWFAIQEWDDLEDEGSCTSHNALIAWFTFEMPRHPFMRAYGHHLLPVLELAVLQWRAANVLETSGDRDDCNKAYMLRAAYYGVLHSITSCLFGHEYAAEIGPEIYRGYGETALSLWKEINNA